MSRAIAVPLLLAVAIAPAAAQEHAADALYLIVQGQGGATVAHATATLQLWPARQLPALASLPLQPARLDFTVEGPRALIGQGDERGVVRIAPGDIDVSGRAASGMVSTTEGLGALVTRLLPGRAERIHLQPMAAVTTATGSEEFTLYAKALLPNGDVIALLPQTGTEVRLPAAVYEVWAHSADGWIWQRLVLASGQRALLHFDAPVQRLHQRDGAAVFPAGFPTVPLFDVDEDTVLRGAALAAPLSSLRFGRMSAPTTLPGPPRSSALEWPPVEDEPPIEKLEAPSASNAENFAALLTLVRTDAGAWRVLHCSPLHAARGDGNGWFETVPTTAGDVALLLLAKGFAPKALPWSERHEPNRLRLEAGQPLVVQARNSSGDPIVDLCVDYAPDQMSPAMVTAHTDARGAARLGPVLAPGRLRISDARFANQEIPLAQIPATGLSVTVLDGAAVTGKVLWPDGGAAHDVLVTLRDTGGTLRPSSRAVTTAADGAFAFPGLPEGALFVVFAQTQRDGHTWSGRFDRARAAGEVLELTVHDEDPHLGNDR